MSENILVGLSGGVDSAVAAARLLEQGHSVVGGYMKNWINTDNIPGDCPWEEDLDDAHAVAQHLGIEFRVIDLIDQYRSRIVDYLLDGYREGITPNPDVFCNREMKFGVFLDYALEQGFDAVATGHYARRRFDEDQNLAMLLRGADTNKDQSYFLALLDQHQLRHARFPTGEMQKTDVRKEAERFGLPNAAKKDSQGICFIGNVKMADFISHYVPDQPGDIVNTEGKVLGQHRGLHLYTLGQRKGHGVASPREGIAYVVVGKNASENQLILAYEEKGQSSEHNPLYHREITVGELSFNAPLSVGEHQYHAQARYRSNAESATLQVHGNSTIMTQFTRPQRALTPGQICAYYDGGRLLGGGVIQSVS